jgi:hypothetical protein
VRERQHATAIAEAPIQRTPCVKRHVPRIEVPFDEAANPAEAAFRVVNQLAAAKRE